MEFIKNSLNNETFIYAVFSNKKQKLDITDKVQLRPMIIKGEYLLQFEYFQDKKVIHKNFDKESAMDEIESLLHQNFKQLAYYDVHKDYQILQNKKGSVKVLEKQPTKKLESLLHNKTKNYLIEDGRACDFLIELDIMGLDGAVHKSKYNKFRQINRFLELIEDVLKDFPEDKEIRMIDFGCGKSYLTFAVYYYLVKLNNRKVEIIGLDLKEDVIEHCNKVAEKLGYGGLRFEVGNIADYKYGNNVDIVFTLHACDIATDAAFLKAIEWNASHILSVPCCQHEFFKQIENMNNTSLLKHGILKEKMAAMITDASRGMFLESYGYDVDIIEFIDMEHTPKNILIKAKKKTTYDEKKYQEWIDYLKSWGIKKCFLLEESK